MDPRRGNVQAFWKLLTSVPRTRLDDVVYSWARQLIKYTKQPAHYCNKKKKKKFNATPVVRFYLIIYVFDTYFIFLNFANTNIYVGIVLANYVLPGPD